MNCDLICQIVDCNFTVRAKGYCKTHYERQRVGGSLEAPIRRTFRGIPFVDRLAIWSEVMPSGCIEWRGRLDSKGYGSVSYQSHRMGAHRAAYLVLVGSIPDGFQIDHLCRNRCCINPSHLEAVTKAENIRRSDNLSAVNARKTHCLRGHEFTPENTRMLPGPRRECRACRRITSQPSGIVRPLHLVRGGGVA